jgi:hypothetical protein
MSHRKKTSRPDLSSRQTGQCVLAQGGDYSRTSFLSIRRVLLLVPQTSQNEIVYSAWMEKLTKKLMSHIAINSMRLPAVAGLSGIWRKRKDIA